MKSLSFQIRDRFNKIIIRLKKEKKKKYLESFIRIWRKSQKLERGIIIIYDSIIFWYKKSFLILCFVYYCLVQKLLFLQFDINFQTFDK